MRISDQIAGLATMSQARLRAEWRRLHKGQIMPKGLGRELATRALAHRLQERLHGGYTPAVTRELRKLAAQMAETGDLEISAELRLKPGTQLVRQWHGRNYHVLMLEVGFQFQDRHYRSLTTIAREITGTNWSGPRFFGLKRYAPA